MAWTTFHHRSRYECGKCKGGSVHLTLTIIFCRCQQTVQLPPVAKPIQLKQTTSKIVQKMFQKKLYNNYVFYVVYCFLCCVLLVCITVLCCANNQMQIIFQRKLYNTMYFVLCIVCCVVYCLLCCVLFVVLCIVCCVSQYCVVPTIKSKFFQQNLIFLS